MQNSGQTNYSSFNYVKSFTDEFNSLCAPLKKWLGIHHFSYEKIFPSGKYFRISSNLEWEKFYRENIAKHSVIWPGEVHLSSMKSNDGLVPALLPKNPNTNLTQAIYQHGLWGAFHFTKYTPEYCEIWGFSKSDYKGDLNLFYLEHCPYLLKFINYFKVKAKGIILVNEKDNDKLGIYQDGVTYPTRQLSTQLKSDAIKRFLKDIRLEDENIVFPVHNISMRERECLHHLALGETIKEIARNLNLSPRTVETYLNQIKGKTGYYIRSDLVKFYQDNFL